MKNQKLFVRILAGILAGVLCLGLVAVAASAEGTGSNVMCRAENVLTNEDYTDDTANTPFWHQYTLLRSWVKTIDFHDTLDGAPANAMDFSAKLDRSVLGWYTPNELHIAADGKIKLNKNASFLFAFFTNVEAINFNGAVDTSEVESMEGMFLGCYNLKSLDLTGFDTSSVTNMSRMFAHCEKLTDLDVTGFSTANVTDFSYMFTFCRGLTALDVTGFNTAAAQFMHSMFYHCDSLSALDVSGFSTSNVRNFGYMFGCCPNLTVDCSTFDTSRSTTQFTLPGC